MGSNNNKIIKILVTLGPSLSNESDLYKLKDKGVDYVRVNMSHSSLNDLEHYISLSKKVMIPFVIDTEGSQIRTEKINGDVNYRINDQVKIYHKDQFKNNQMNIGLKPSKVLYTLEPGDILYIDFRSLSVLITDIDDVNRGFIKGKVLTEGILSNSKGVYVDSFIEKDFKIDTLSDKDMRSIEIGITKNVKYIAASFIRSAKCVKTVRNAVDNKMKIISKIECREALLNIDEIIDESDYLLLDRGDLSKEIPLEKIPLIQKFIISKANYKKKMVFVATNLLESMIENKMPTKAEVHDIITSIFDGAEGLTLSAETAIGKHPLQCVNMVRRLINHTNESSTHHLIYNSFIKPKKMVIIDEYFSDHSKSSLLIKPHGGSLINRIKEGDSQDDKNVNSKIIIVNNRNIIDLEQIAIGTYSPIEGFMDESELNSVLDEYHLSSGHVWTMPVVLDIDINTAKDININERFKIANKKGIIIGEIDITDVYKPNKDDLCKRLFDVSDSKHSGVKLIKNLKSVFIGGKIKLYKENLKNMNPYNLSPKQIRRLFDEMNWQTVIGFHTRNVIHKAHEYIQSEALKLVRADGLLLHPAVGEKIKDDYSSDQIIKSYEYMMDKIYTNEKYCFATLPIYSRYSGIREALFTAICRQNYGCSHFIMGRDHTNMDELKHLNSGYNFENLFDELEIEILKFSNVVYSMSKKEYLFYNRKITSSDFKSISATMCRKLLKQKIIPPSWMMRPEISKLILKNIYSGDKVFI